MQPFPNPNYYAQYPPYNQPNPYIDRMAQLQQLQQFQHAINPSAQSANSFQPLGKIVESIDVVKATDIPMDGSVYYFPKADGSAVFTKQWLETGTTRILTFKPILDVDMVEISSEEEKSPYKALEAYLGAIQEDIKALTEKVEKISKPAKAKKEVAEDE